MKRVLKFGILFLATAVVLAGCKKEDKGDKDGLTKDVRNIIPDDILEKFKELGIDINGGLKPPNIEGVYFVTPLILKKSNFNDSYSVGSKFSDMTITFSKQDNSKLTVVTDYVQGNQKGNGLGSFITGSGNKFSIYTEIAGTLSGNPFTNVEIYSGEITADGIKDFHWALLVTVEGIGTIKRGEGRLFYDSDGISPKQSGAKNSVQISTGTSFDALLPSSVYSK